MRRVWLTVFPLRCLSPPCLERRVLFLHEMQVHGALHTGEKGEKEVPLGSNGLRGAAGLAHRCQWVGAGQFANVAVDPLLVGLVQQAARPIDALVEQWPPPPRG